MYKIEIHYEAENEMIEAAEYYQGKIEGLGFEFLDEVEAGFNQIRKFPLAWSIYEGEYRRYLVKRFPYGLIYRIELETISIIAVAHLHRNPGYWKSRK